VFTPEVSYGMTDRLAFHATLPVIHVSFKGKTLTGENVSTSDTKLGDLSLVAQYFWLFGYFAAPTMFSLGIGVNIPSGGGIKNPVASDRNFVSGTVDPIFLSSIIFTLQGPWSANASVYARPIFSEADDSTKSGSFLFVGVGTGFSFIFSENSGLDVSLGASGLHRAQDKINDQPFVNSGGNWIYITPGVKASFLGRGIHRLQLSMGMEIPVYQNVQGNQLTEDWTLRFGLSYGLHLFSVME